jgi:uncharacterized protein YfaS (alpha-2-macroglobulin family)
MSVENVVRSQVSPWSVFLPRSLSTIVGMGLIGGAIAFGVQTETPMGRISGQAFLEQTMKPARSVTVYLSGEDLSGERRYFRGKTDNNGAFRFLHVPAGSYMINAYGTAHDSGEVQISVDEGKTTEISLGLKRNHQALGLVVPQRVFSPDEEVGFSVRGYVDGNAPQEGDALTLRIYRTKLSRLLQNPVTANALRSLNSSYDMPPRLSRQLLHPPGQEPLRILQQRRIPIRGADLEGFFYQRVQLDALKVGTYLYEVEHGKDIIGGWLVVTNTGIVMKKAGREALIYTADLTEGKPLPETDVRLYINGRQASSSKTDAKGLARFYLPQGRPVSEEEAVEKRLVVIAARGEDEAALLSREYESAGGSRYVVHAYTDRPIYRPGQRIQYKAIARRLTERVYQYAVPNGVTALVEVRDPTGERVVRESKTVSMTGSFFGSFDLDEEAPSGVYSMIITISGEKHVHELVVASYRKPEYSVTVTSDKPRYAPNEPIQMTVSGQYYFGAPVAGAKVTYTVYRSQDWQAYYAAMYGDADDLDMDDEQGYSYGETVADGSTTLDENGRAVIAFYASLPQDERPSQDYIYTASISVTDASGREVTAEGTARMSVGDFRLLVQPSGYLAAPGSPHNILVAALDYENRPVTGVKVVLEVGYNRLKQWEEGEEYVFETTAVLSAVTGQDGRAVIPITPPRSGSILLKARTLDRQNRSIRAHAELWAMDDAGGEDEAEYENLSLLTDKRRYEPGETARILINTQRVGMSVLLTLEGDRIYKTIVLPIKQRSTVYRLAVLKEYGPNVILKACYVKRKEFAASEVSLRVAMPQKELRVAIQPDRTNYKPGDPIRYQIQITDTQGQPVVGEFSLGVVDESIYALREDSPKAFRNAFYPRRYTQVETQYSFALEYLGDADKAEPKIVTRKRFEDTAFWQPAVQTDSQGRATVQFNLPDNLTTWRATVQAFTPDMSIGRQISKVVVSKEFFVRLETPRFLTQRDESRVMALVHNETGEPQTVLVRLRVEGVALSGNPEQTLTVEPGGVATATWQVRAERVGRADFKVTAWTPRVSGVTQYTDGVERSLPVLPFGRLLVHTLAGELTSDRPQTETIRFEPDAIPEASQWTVRITPSIIGAFSGSLEYLIGYPYGCVEQTMSRFLPTLLVDRHLGSYAAAAGVERRQLPKMVRSGLTRLYRMQHASGAWGWWEQDADDPWMTAYVLYGLAMAKQAGYPVNETALQRGKEAAAKMVPTAREDNRAFLLYALTLSGDQQTYRAQRAKFDWKKTGAEALSYLILADRLMGREDPQIISELNRTAFTADGLLSWKPKGNRSEWNATMVTATALRALLAVNPQDVRAGTVVRWLMRNRTGEYWSSTRDTAWVLAAFCDYLRESPSEQPTGEVSITLNGQRIQTFRFTPENLREGELVARIPAANLKPGKNDLLLERTGGTSRVFYSVDIRQMVGMETALPEPSRKIGIKREYLRVVPQRAGDKAWQLKTEPTGNRISQGELIRVRLSFEMPEEMSYVLIEDPFPSGCEVTERGNASEVDTWSYWWASVDIRDHKVAFFARSMPKGRHVIEYHLRAQTPGNYRTLPTMLQGMYAPQTRSESASESVEIR